MRLRVLLAMLMIPLATHADDLAATPAGWTKSADGSYAHSDSGIVCSAKVNAYTLQRVDGPADPNILGTCVYSGGDKRIGLIRIRKFVDGVGETPLAIQNDRGLMGLVPMSGGPPGAKPVEAFRSGPGPIVDGTQLGQFVITSVHKGLLSDCISQTTPDQAERDFGFDNFVKSCPKPD
jgi:hypothetical protein